jgi:hypothetical protein
MRLLKTSAPPGPIWETIRKPARVRALNAAGAGLRTLGADWPRLDVATILARAQWSAGLSDFGDGSFRDGLEALVDAFHRRGTASAFGRMVFRQYLTGLLVGRLRVQDELARHPEILDVPGDRPQFFSGLPRSGTTLLHRLMSQDPAGRPLLHWEAFAPAPAPDPETYRDNPRINAIRYHLEQLEALSPRLSVAHEFAVASPEEDNNLHARDFVTPYLGFLFDVPDYARWLSEVPPARVLETYRYARRQLQLLGWKIRGDHWVLKAPSHQYSLAALLGAHPDACVIITHRDPRAVTPSACSLAAAVRGVHADRLDLRALGEELVQTIAVGPVRAIEARRSLDPSRFLDVGYDRLVADPIGVARDAYAYFGYEFTPAFEANARRWLGENPRHKRGIHRYRLEDFGLDGQTVDRHFARYRAWLEDRPELGVAFAD